MQAAPPPTEIPGMAGQILAEVQAGRSACVYFENPSWCLIEIQGSDARHYLHNRTTSDVKQLTQAGHGQYSALLDRKAHLQAYFSLHQINDAGDTYWAITDSNCLDTALSEIKKYQIMEQFSLNVRSDLGMLLIEGPHTVAVLATLFPALPALPTIEGHFIHLDSWQNEAQPDNQQTITLVRRGLTGEVGYTLVAAPCTLQQIQETLSKTNQAIPISPEAVEILRIEAGIPLMGKDMDTERLFPETGLEQQAVSYTKGCYLGQETVARVKTYGSIPKALTGLLLPLGSPLPVPGSAIVLKDGSTVGTFASSTHSPTLQQTLAMAYLDKAHRVPGRLLELQNSIAATVCMLPFYRNQAAIEAAASKVSEGLTAYANGQTEDAIALLQEALQLNPRNGDVYESLGVILSKLDRYEEAIALMHELVSLEPERIMAHTNLSVYYMKLGDKERAEEEKAQAMVLQMKQAMKNAGTKKEEAEAQAKREQLTRDRIALFEKALALNPTDPLALFGIGNSYLELKQFAQAISPLSQAVAAQPNHLDGYLALGKCYEATGESSQAKSTYEAGLEVASKRGERNKIEAFTQRLGRF